MRETTLHSLHWYRRGSNLHSFPQKLTHIPLPRKRFFPRCYTSRCDKVIETGTLFSLLCTVFAVLHCFPPLEASGNSFFSLFCTVSAHWKHLEIRCFRCFALFSPIGSIWKLTVFAVLHCFRPLVASGSSMFSLFCTVFGHWKHLEVHCFRCFALF